MQALFSADTAITDIQIQDTRPEFEGDLTIVVFPLVRASKKSPPETAKMLGEYLEKHLPEIIGHQVVKGFLNLSLSSGFWLGTLNAMREDQVNVWEEVTEPQRILVEYSSPNTNKPLHLGHVRNNLLGYSVSQILKARGHEVIMANLINDKGVHISKSMLAWMRFGNEETPESTGIKGDKLVGYYYVMYDQKLKQQVSALMEKEGLTKEEATKKAPLTQETQELYRQWEKGNSEVLRIWEMMNGWVYKGFEETYKKLGVQFDLYQYESNTYKLGKEIVIEGLEKDAFQRKTDGAVFVDLTDEKLDEKVLMRSDGTSIYITQDLGTAQERFDKHNLDRLIYVVGNEQDYHFKVLAAIFKKMGREWWDSIYHLSYGMVDLPSGKMKSREGTVVDADDLIGQMITEAETLTTELGKLEGLSGEEQKELFRMIGLAALKFFILRVDPQKRMLFNPQESIELNGFTGPFVQYTYARIQSILRKHGQDQNFPVDVVGLTDYDMKVEEHELIRLLYNRNHQLEEAERNLSPAVLVNYAYELAKAYNKFYHECPVLSEEHEAIRDLRLLICQQTGRVIKDTFRLVGIEVPEQM